MAAEHPWKQKKVGVLMGGLSSERDVSLRSGKAISGALKSLGYSVVDIDAGRDLAQVLIQKKVDVVFNALHGKYGEDGCVQGLLEIAGIPYTGPGVTSAAISMDKAAAKKIFRAAGLTEAPFVELDVRQYGTPAAAKAYNSPFGYPVVVKPNDEGSSVGVSIVKTRAKLADALRDAFGYSQKVIVERYVKGREIAVAVLGDRALGTVEIRTRREFYDYKAKYTKGETEYLVPAPLDTVIEHRLSADAILAHKVTGCDGLSRIDFIVTDTFENYVLEVNTLPGMTELSLVPKIAARAGIPFPQLCERILDTASLKLGGKGKKR